MWFTNVDNLSVGALLSWRGRVYAGTTNLEAGCEVWRGDRYPLFEDGFESGSTDAWSTTTP